MASNFAFVQDTSLTSHTGALTQSFVGGNTAGNIIIVMVWQWPPTSSAVVTDSNGNTTKHIRTAAGFMDLWAAVNVKSGANRVTASAGGGDLTRRGYSSINPNYYVCPAAWDISSAAVHERHCSRISLFDGDDAGLGRVRKPERWNVLGGIWRHQVQRHYAV